MEIETDDDILRKVASGGIMDYSSWPLLLPAIVSRIEKIAHDEFPIPNIPPPAAAPPPPEPRFLAPLPSSDPIEPPEASDTQTSSQETNKENASPSVPPSAAIAPSVPAPILAPLEPGILPAQISSLLGEITDTLSTGFPQYPPHTMQRLAELVLSPKQHYRSLAAYLHALDRVVHVTSGANVYPLPPAIPDISAMSLLANGVGATSVGASGSLGLGPSGTPNIGSDEALGGALLTPIPWLTRRATSTNGGDEGTENSGHGHAPSQPQQAAPQVQPQASRGGQPQGRHLEGRVRTESTETIDGPNGMGSIETVSVSVNGIPSIGARALLRGVTQGELLRQEQRAGVVPVSQLARSSTGGGVVVGDGAGPTATRNGEGQEESPDDDAAMADEVPHARGPEEIGAADTGPQSASASYQVSGGGVEIHGIDVEAAVGRRHDHERASPEQHQRVVSPGVASSSPKREAEEELDGSASKKRLKEADDSAVAEEPQQPEKDAEGDLVLPEVPAEGDGGEAAELEKASADGVQDEER